MGERVRDLCARDKGRRVSGVCRALMDQFEETFDVVLLGVELCAGLIACAVLAAVGVPEIGDCVGRAGGVLEWNCQ